MIGTQILVTELLFSVFVLIKMFLLSLCRKRSLKIKHSHFKRWFLKGERLKCQRTCLVPHLTLNDEKFLRFQIRTDGLQVRAGTSLSPVIFNMMQMQVPNIRPALKQKKKTASPYHISVSSSGDTCMRSLFLWFSLLCTLPSMTDHHCHINFTTAAFNKQAKLRECWQPLLASVAHLDLDANLPNWSVSQNRKTALFFQNKWC